MADAAVVKEIEEPVPEDLKKDNDTKEVLPEADKPASDEKDSDEKEKDSEESQPKSNGTPSKNGENGAGGDTAEGVDAEDGPHDNGTTTKRKIEADNTAADTPAEGASPEKKAKLDEKLTEANGEAEATA